MTSQLKLFFSFGRLLWPALGVLWVIATCTGLALLTRYSNAPAAMRPGPQSWPSDSRLQLSNDRATLVMFAHPRCGCTRASLGELEKIVARHRDEMAPWVVFLKPDGTDTGWERTDLWRTAAAIPGVQVVSDSNGVEAGRFQADTSGQTLLFSKRGELLFKGGITFARGHAGDNAGRTAIETYLRDESPGYRHTPVFGCGFADNRRGTE